MNASFPRHLENIPTGRCAHCRCEAMLPWAFGVQQEKRLCNVCGEHRWRKLLEETGRADNWERMMRGQGG